MQQDGVAPEVEGVGFPELNELGRRIEVLRIQRGISKQHLARYAATSRQQLWRVMTGKSELTSSLRERLAQALGVAPGDLVRDPAAAGEDRATSGWPAAAALALEAKALPSATMLDATPSPPALVDYLSDHAHLMRTLATLPAGSDGLRLKRQLLNALEDLALERSLALPAAFFETRRRVLAGEL